MLDICRPKFKPPAWCILKHNGACYIWEDFRDSEEVCQMVFYDKHCITCVHRVKVNGEKVKLN